MKWFRYIRVLILGVGIVIVSLTEGRFDSLGSALVTILFAILGIALIAFITWSAIVDLRRMRLEVTPVPESDDAGIGFFRRERAEQERAERERA